MTAPKISDEIAQAFLAAEHRAERAGDTQTSYAAGLAAVYPLIVAEFVAAVERGYAKQAGGCACPPEHQRNCGYRKGIGEAADAVRALAGAS